MLGGARGADHSVPAGAGRGVGCMRGRGGATTCCTCGRSKLRPPAVAGYTAPCWPACWSLPPRGRACTMACCSVRQAVPSSGCAPTPAPNKHGSPAPPPPPHPLHPAPAGEVRQVTRQQTHDDAGEGRPAAARASTRTPGCAHPQPQRPCPAYALQRPTQSKTLWPTSAAQSAAPAPAASMTLPARCKVRHGRHARLSACSKGASS
jgi:hypothetical protein